MVRDAGGVVVQFSLDAVPKPPADVHIAGQTATDLRATCCSEGHLGETWKVPRCKGISCDGQFFSDGMKETRSEK